MTISSVFINFILNYLQFILNNLEKKTIKCIVFQEKFLYLYRISDVADA